MKVLIGLLIVFAAWRVVVLAGVPAPVSKKPELAAIASLLNNDPNAVSRVPELVDGIESVQIQVFDPNVPVLLGPGKDGAPGRLGFDDNFNGDLDDQQEIGAVGSDDTCLAPWNKEYQPTLEHDQAVTISRGTFVPATLDNGSGKRSVGSKPSRARCLVLGLRDGVSWSRLLYFDDPAEPAE